RRERRSGKQIPLLQCKGVEVAYDQVQVLFGADIEVQPGEIVALLGTNGAGKSTLLKAISGVVDPIGGAIFFDGRDITHAGGEQQMLALGMAFIAKPRLLMIDELSLGLAPAIVEQLLDIVRRIRDNGTAVILVEQSINIALTVAERAYFMEKGEVRFEGPTA